MTVTPPDGVMVSLDAETRALVRLAARIAGGSEADVREGMREVQQAGAPAVWVEELILQSYLFCGFPRALNAARVWKSEGGDSSGTADSRTASEVRADGEATCAKVYGTVYDRLRHAVADLHPLLDEWMITEGYGKVLSRPQLDLRRRELCTVAACAASGQERQLQSHLRGCINVGVVTAAVREALDALEGVVAGRALERARVLLADGGRRTADG